MQNFSREALLTASLEHPNIIPVHDLGTDDQELPYFTMKLMKGNNLKDSLKRIILFSNAWKYLELYVKALHMLIQKTSFIWTLNQLTFKLANLAKS